MVYRTFKHYSVFNCFENDAGKILTVCLSKPEKLESLSKSTFEFLHSENYIRGQNFFMQFNLLVLVHQKEFLPKYNNLFLKQ